MNLVGYLFVFVLALTLFSFFVDKIALGFESIVSMLRRITNADNTEKHGEMMNLFLARDLGILFSVSCGLMFTLIGYVVGAPILFLFLFVFLNLMYWDEFLGSINNDSPSTVVYLFDELLDEKGVLFYLWAAVLAMGYLANIGYVISGLGDTVTGLYVFRVVGVTVFPIGILLGMFG